LGLKEKEPEKHVIVYSPSESEGSVRHEFLICINQTGTASSSPMILTASPPNKVFARLWYQKRGLC